LGPEAGVPNKPNLASGDARPTATIVRNKANFHQRADREIGVPGGNLAKQTQLGPVRIRAKYIAAKKLGAIRRNMDTGKTKPISGGQDTPPFHYSIIPVFLSRCAKQSQFAKMQKVHH
jgi:hypothetical protein